MKYRLLYAVGESPSQQGENMKPKIHRNRALVLLRTEYPKLSFSQLGGRFGISRQAAHQIYHRDKAKPKKNIIKRVFWRMIEALNMCLDNIL